MPQHRPRLGPLVHSLLTTPTPEELLSRFYYAGPVPDDQVALTWLGTAGFSVEHQGQVMLVDPYVSRPGMRRSLTQPLVSHVPAIERWAPRADLIVCTHSHHDHIMDVPEIARRTGAQVVGSRSSCNFCRASGVPESQVLDLTAPQTVEFGPFRVTVRASIHGRAVLNRVPLEGSIPADVRTPLRMKQFRNDETYGVLVEVGQGDHRLKLFHLNSADFTDQTTEGLSCHVLLPCLVGRHRRAGFTAELLQALRPGVVIPHHFDDFFQPLDSDLRQLPKADLAGFFDEVAASGVPCRVAPLNLLGRVRFTLDGELVE